MAEKAERQNASTCYRSSICYSSATGRKAERRKGRKAEGAKEAKEVLALCEGILIAPDFSQGFGQ